MAVKTMNFTGNKHAICFLDPEPTVNKRGVELAVQDNDGSWVFIDEFASVDEAIESAESYFDGDDTGLKIFGITKDPDGGHYEIQYVTGCVA